MAKQKTKEYGVKAKGKRGQGGIQGLIGLMVSLLILIAVVYPVIKDTISDLALTGTEAVLGNMLPMLLLVAGVVMVTYLFGRAV